MVTVINLPIAPDVPPVISSPAVNVPEEELMSDDGGYGNFVLSSSV